MNARRRPYWTMRPALGSLLVISAMLYPLTQVAAEEQRQYSVSPPRQTAPPSQNFRSMSPVQTPASAAPPGNWQYNPSGPNATAHIQQYNPPGLNAPSGTHPIQANPPSLTTHQEMTNPGGLGAAGAQAGSQGAPGPGGSAYPVGYQGAPGPGGSAYPVGYQGPSAIQPPYAYQPQPAYSRQFTCRTVHYYCLVPYTGACDCENDRRERERGATVD